MATVVVNTPNHVEFKNVVPGVAGDAQPTLIVQAGSWTENQRTEIGVVFDVYGEQTPILTLDDARKLAKWLNRAADVLEGKKPEKKHKQKHWQDDDDNYDEWRT